MSDESFTLVPGLQPHDHHPGWESRNCYLAIKITAQTRFTMNGIACSATGGHCLPGEKCADRVKRAQEHDALFEQVREA